MMKNKLLVILGVVFLFFAVSTTGFAKAESSVCGDGFCNLDKGESWQNCPEDCIKEDTPLQNRVVVSHDRERTRILPESFLKFFGDENNDLIFIVPFLITIIIFLFLLLSKTKIARKTLKEYIFPIKYYIIGSILIVISQYTVALPLFHQHPFLLNLTQGLWVAMVALSVVKLVKEGGFNIKNILFLGVLYSFIIHGLKVSIRYFFYNKPIWYLIDRFLYGSLLVMSIVIIIGLILLYLKKKNSLYLGDG